MESFAALRAFGLGGLYVCFGGRKFLEKGDAREIWTFFTTDWEIKTNRENTLVSQQEEKVSSEEQALNAGMLVG